MTPSPDDDARAIPKRRPPGGAARPGAAEEDVYVVDTRGRRPQQRRVGGAKRPGDEVRPAPGVTDEGRREPPRNATRAMPTRASDRPQRPSPQGTGGRTGPPPRGGRLTDSRQPGRGGPPGAPPARRRHGVRRVALLLIVALLAYVGFQVWAPMHAWQGVQRVADAPAGSRPASGSGHNYLLVGSDSRAGLSAAERKKLGTGADVGQRTDSIILVHVPGDGGKRSMISIPRDSYVPIPGHHSNKINAAFAIGGPKLLIQTVEQVTDLRIDGYLEIGFAGFSQLVDAMGGVEICVPFHMDDAKAHINLQKGCQTLNGPNALGFVRARYSDPRGDIGRAERQRQFLGAIMKKMATPRTVLVPWTWWDTTHAAVAGITVGEGTSLQDAYRIVQTMRSVTSGGTLSLVVPIQSLSYQTSAGDAVKWDTARAKALFTMLRDGTPINAPPPGTDGKPSGG